MAATASRAGRRGGIVGINVTPMVDVVLVLLVILMVSSTYIVSQSLKVELPKTASSDETVAATLSVTVNKDGDLFLDGKPILEDALSVELRDTCVKNPDVNLVISADGGALHGRVVRVIDLAKVEGVTKFAIRVEKRE